MGERRFRKAEAVGSNPTTLTILPMEVMQAVLRAQARTADFIRLV